MPRPPPALLALSSGAHGARALQERVAAAFGAGLRGVVLREPAMGDKELLALARALRALLDPARGGWLCVHDRPHLAEASAADAVHLGHRSLALPHVRPWLPEGVAIGLSTHAGDDPSAWAGADYLVHGPLREVDKPHAGRPVGSEGLEAAVRAAPAPVWALGGVRPEDVAGALRCGAGGVAVMSRLLGSADPAASTAAYLAALERCS